MLAQPDLSSAEYRSFLISSLDVYPRSLLQASRPKAASRCLDFLRLVVRRTLQDTLFLFKRRAPFASSAIASHSRSLLNFFSFHTRENLQLACLKHATNGCLPHYGALFTWAAMGPTRLYSSKSHIICQYRPQINHKNS